MSANRVESGMSVNVREIGNFVEEVIASLADGALFQQIEADKSVSFFDQGGGLVATVKADGEIWVESGNVWYRFDSVHEFLKRFNPETVIQDKKAVRTRTRRINSQPTVSASRPSQSADEYCGKMQSCVSEINDGSLLQCRAGFIAGDSKAARRSSRKPERAKTPSSHPKAAALNPKESAVKTESDEKRALTPKKTPLPERTAVEGRDSRGEEANDGNGIKEEPNTTVANEEVVEPAENTSQIQEGAKASSGMARQERAPDSSTSPAVDATAIPLNLTREGERKKRQGPNGERLISAGGTLAQVCEDQSADVLPALSNLAPRRLSSTIKEERMGAEAEENSVNQLPSDKVAGRISEAGEFAPSSVSLDSAKRFVRLDEPIDDRYPQIISVLFGALAMSDGDTDEVVVRSDIGYPAFFINLLESISNLVSVRPHGATEDAIEHPSQKGGGNNHDHNDKGGNGQKGRQGSQEGEEWAENEYDDVPPSDFSSV